MKPILEIQHISKKFTIQSEQQPYLSLRDSLSSVFKPKNKMQDFWALNDVSFNVEQGDTIGIIGKNGAGKSTLLKILSRITPPTSGKIICRGRIASLLEVGTGFHPELSGRENVFMNGSILGMRKAEILKNFDAIVDFAGIDKFIDTPLKHYSSGMQLRLAFAVAAFLENEILIIDEVLAVGDAEFQKKCMGKMGDISQSGRTILFVSHNMYALNQLCENSILLEKGEVKKTGHTVDVIDYYNAKSINENGSNDSLPVGSNILLETISFEKNILKFKLSLKKAELIPSIVFYINNVDGLRLAIIDCRTTQFPLRQDENSNVLGEVNVDNFPMVEGDYFLGIYIESHYFKGNVDNILKITHNEKATTKHHLIKYPKQYRGIIDLNYQINYL